MGLENFRPSSPESSEGKIPAVEQTLQGLKAKVQARAALDEYRAHHPDAVVDFEHPENNPSEIRNGAMMEWVTSGSAAEFGEFFDKNPLNPQQAQDLREVLNAFKANRNTIH